MIAAGIGNHSAAALLACQRCDLVVSAPEFESADRLQVFEFEKQPAAVAGSTPFKQGCADRHTAKNRLSPLYVCERNHRIVLSPPSS